MPAIKNASAVGLTFTYNGITVGGASNDSTTGQNFIAAWPVIDLATEVVYEESGRDAIGWDVTCSIKTALFRSTATAPEIAMQIANVTARLLYPNQTLTVPVGYGFEIGLNGNAGSYDIDHQIDLYGVRPIRCVMKPIPGTEGVLLDWSFRYRVNRYASNETGGNLNSIKGWSHRTAYGIDRSGTHTINLTYIVHVLARASQRGLYTAEDALNNPASTMSISVLRPYNFQLVSLTTESSPDKTSATRNVVFQQHAGERPPLGMVDSGGSFVIDIPNAQTSLFTNAVATLDRTYEVARQSSYHLAPLAFIQEVLHVFALIQDQLTVASGTQPRYSVILTKLSMMRGRGRDSRYWRCQAAWHLTGCIANLAFSEKVYETPKETLNPTYSEDVAADAAWDVSAGAGQYARAVALRENQSNDAPANLDASNDTSKTIEYLFNALNLLDSTYGMTCNVNQVNPLFSWFYYNMEVTTLTRQQVQQHYRMHPNTPSLATPDEDADGSNSIIAVQPGDTSSAFGADARRIEDTGYAHQLVQMTFVGIRLAHKPTFPTLTTAGGAPLKAIAEMNQAPKLIGNIFGCPVYHKRYTALYIADASITYTGKVQDLTQCITEVMPDPTF